MGISAPSFITVGDVVRGSEVTITWGAVSNAIGYTVNRSLNGAAFGVGDDPAGDIPQVANTYITQTVGENWDTVQYRVRAWGYSDDGSHFVDSDWTVSEVKTASSAPAPPPTPSGDRLEQFQNSDGTNIYPKTVVEGVFRQSDGKSLEQILNETGTSVPAGGVTSFKGRTGAVTPQSGDYIAAQVGAVPTSRKVNGQALSSDITIITCGTADLTAGSSPLAAGTLYGVYEV